MLRSQSLRVLTAVGALSLFAACASQEYALLPTPRTPSTVGSVKVEKTENKNQQLEMTFQHLPPPTQLDPASNTLVVWLKPLQGAEAMNVGQIQVSDERSAELEVTTPYTAFDVMVTAETNPRVLRPSEVVVLKGHVDLEQEN